MASSSLSHIAFPMPYSPLPPPLSTPPPCPSFLGLHRSPPSLHHSLPISSSFSPLPRHLPGTTACCRGVVAMTGSELLLLEPDFYRIGYIRHVRAYGVEFKEGPSGVGVYVAKDIPYLRKPRVILEIPLELMITVSKYPPWMFHPDIVPWGHPIFDVINSTDAEKDWDVRLACLLLLALDTPDNFWQLYGDFLPEANDCSSLLLATEGELSELQDVKLAQSIRQQQRRAEKEWIKHWTADSPKKMKRLAHTSEHFKWALSMVWTRHFKMTMSVGAKVQEADMLIPYVDMMNHSFEPTCSFRWRKRDRMLEVVINAGQTITKGSEMTLNYMDRSPNEKYVMQYGFSAPANPWDPVSFLGNSKIHLDSFLSAFNIAGLLDDYYYNEDAVQDKEELVDGTVIAAARTLPSWSDNDLPFLPSMEKAAVQELQQECLNLLGAFPTTLEDDMRILSSDFKRKSRRWKAALEYRVHRKGLIKQIMVVLDLYLNRIMI